MRGLLIIGSIYVIAIFFYHLTINHDKLKKYPYSCNMVYLKGKQDIFKKSTVKHKKEENIKIVDQENEIIKSQLLTNIYDDKMDSTDLGTYSSITRISNGNNDNYRFSSDNFV